MISEGTLYEKRHAYLSSFEDKINKKLESFKNEQLSIIENKCKIFEQNHDEIDSKLYRNKLILEFENKYKKLEHKYGKKYASMVVKTEAKDRELLHNSKRVWEIDFLRGVAILGMIVDHWSADFWMFFKNIFENGDKGWLGFVAEQTQLYWDSSFRIGVRLFGVFLFVFLCGVSTRFSKNNWKRSLGLTGFGLAITILLAFVSKILNNPDLQILLSTLTTIGLCLLIYTGVSTLCKFLFGNKSWKWISLGIFVTCSIFWAILASWNYLNIEVVGSNVHDLDTLFDRFYFIFNNNGNDIGWFYGYENLDGSNIWKVLLGLKGFGSDWLGLFPYVGYIFLGGFVGETVYKDKKSIIKYFYHKEDTKLTGEAYFLSKQGQMNAKINMKLSFFSYPGRHTLFVYVFHQPIFFAIMIPIILLTGYKLISLW